MVSIPILKARGIESDKLKSLFTAEVPSEEVKRLTNRIRDRIIEARRKNLSEYRLYAAIDIAYEAPFAQTTPTLVRDILNRKLDAKGTCEALSCWGLSQEELFLERVVDGKSILVPNPPTFFSVLVPLVKAYVTIRLAKLFNDRNQTPLLKYEPLKSTEEDRTICEIITDIVQTMSTQYGYPAVLRQSILQSLLYAQCLVFPREAWNEETQLAYAEDGSIKPFRVREGLRYYMPHPTRMYLDPYHRPSTINTSSGVEYGGYWCVKRYADILGNSTYWNTDKVSYGNNNWFDMAVAGNYFTEVYPCTMRMPEIGQVKGDREKSLNFYTHSEADKAVFVTEHFECLNPKENGLGDYDYPVWFRFVMANDNTVLWCEPIGYTPILSMQYDANELASRSSSLALEIIPWQDQLGNALSQILLTAKANQMHLIFYDKNIVDKSVADDLARGGNKLYRGATLVPYDGRQAMHAQNDVSRAFQKIDFTPHSTAELVNVIGTILNLLERLLVMSAQETGGSQSHEVTAEEVRVISNSTSTRVTYTGTFIEEFTEAWKQQNYEALMNYMDEEFVVSVKALTDDQVAKLKAIGLNVGETKEGRSIISGRTKKHLFIEGFASPRDNMDRTNNPAIAQVMLQTIQSVASNPVLMQAVGPEQIVDYLNQAAVLAGAARDFKLRIQPGAKPEEQAQQSQEQIQQQVQQMGQQIMQATQQNVAEQVVKPVAEEIAKQDAKIGQLAEVLGKMQQMIDAVASAPPVPAPQSLDTSIPYPPAPVGAGQFAPMVGAS